MHLAPWCMTQQLVLRETDFYLQAYSLGWWGRGVEAVLLSALLSHESQHIFCSPPGCTLKPPKPEVLHILICS